MKRGLSPRHYGQDAHRLQSAGRKLQLLIAPVIAVWPTMWLILSPSPLYVDEEVAPPIRGVTETVRSEWASVPGCLEYMARR
jgi:hypothetical protein